MSSLKKILKSKDPVRRYNAIDELADLRSDWAISKLKRIANGKRVSLLGLRRYYYEDQKHALEAMVNIKRKGLRDFLTEFFNDDHKEFRSSYIDELNRPIWGYRLHLFSNASGDLRNRLIYTDTLEYGGCYGIIHWIGPHITNYSHDDPKFKGYRIIERNKEAHKLKDYILNYIKYQ